MFGLGISKEQQIFMVGLEEIIIQECFVLLFFRFSSINKLEDTIGLVDIAKFISLSNPSKTR